MMMLTMFRSLLLSSLAVLSITTTTVDAAIRFNNSDEFYDALMEGKFDVIIDTRNPSEWAAGHIENATFLDSLQRFNTSSQVAVPADLFGCRYECKIVVYCASGNRAAGAIEVLEAAGFHSPIYNGLGATQWVAAGYPLVKTKSKNPECNQTTDDVTAIGRAIPPVPKSCMTGEPMPNAPSTTNDSIDSSDDDSGVGALGYSSGLAVVAAVASMMVL